MYHVNWVLGEHSFGVGLTYDAHNDTPQKHIQGARALKRDAVTLIRKTKEAMMLISCYFIKYLKRLSN